MKTTTRALLALSLLSGFYLLVLAVVVADIGVLVAMVIFPTTNDNARLFGIPSNAMTPIAASAPLLAAIFYGVFTVSRPNDRIVGSVLLLRTKAPELWEVVEELADLVGTRPPTEIRLIGEANAMVSEESYLLGLFPGRARVLYVGAPLLVGLRADELRAVLSHELGHYARKHTRLAAIVYRGSAALRTMMEQLHEAVGGGRRRLFVGYSVIMYMLLSRYGKLYHRIAFRVTRQQELEADAAAARIVGPEIIAEALRAVHAISVSWEKFEGQILTPMRRSGRLPDDPFSAYQSMLDDPHYRDEFARLRYEIPQEANKPLDSHPSLATRLHTLGGLPDEVVDLDFRPAIDLYPEYQTSFERVRAGLYWSNPKPVPWKDWLTMAAETRAVEPARALKRAEARLGSSKQARQPLLAAVLNLLEANQGLALAQHLDDAEPDDDDAESLARLLTALFRLVGQGLVQINAATWHLSWTGASTLVPRDITAQELIDLIAAAIRDPLEVPRLRLHLASLGLKEDAQIALGGQATKPGLLNVNPLIDEDEKQRRKGMATAAIVTMFGLLFVLVIVANTPLAKREQASNQFRPEAQQSPLDYSQYQNDYSAPAYPYAAPTWTLSAPRITLPTGLPSYLRYPLPSYLFLPTDGVSTIVVHSGDSLSAIAQRCDTTVADLQRANDMGSSTLLNAGQTLKIPSIGVFLPAGCE